MDVLTAIFLVLTWLALLLLIVTPLAWLTDNLPRLARRHRRRMMEQRR
jgi:hypothetical protein